MTNSLHDRIKIQEEINKLEQQGRSSKMPFNSKIYKILHTTSGEGNGSFHENNMKFYLIVNRIQGKSMK